MPVPAPDNPSELRSRVIGYLSSRPFPIWTGAALQLVGALGCFVAASFPLSPHAPRVMQVCFGAVLSATGLGVWFGHRRVTVLVLELMTVMGIGFISALIAASATVQGAMLTSFVYTWSVVYAAYNFPRRATVFMLVLLTIGFGISISYNHIPRIAILFPLAAGSFWTTGLILERLADELRGQAETDTLTGVLNRRGFVRRAQAARDLANRNQSSLHVLLIDLDGFKAVNDLEGHEFGDRVLADIASAWRNELGSADLISRFGGDEFVLLLSSRSAAGVASVLERLRGAHPIAWSAGVSEWQSGTSLDDSVHQADIDLYANKAARRTPLEEPARVLEVVRDEEVL